ncbi:hypothetical protein [Hymenobacter sp. B1770]|uniref:hypothetical protein n=1 Tax=Hymenobacter sp. B1770 TaxID=1718788 RepID=UPI003CF3B15D
MTASSDPNDELHRPTDPARLGADQGPGSAPEDDPKDFSSVMAQADGNPNGEGPRPHTPDNNSGNMEAGGQLGSEFDKLRRQGASGSADGYGAVGQSEGLGRAGFNGDEDRGYDQSGHRGGLGTSGGREDLSGRHFDAEGNPFTGGYSGGDYGPPDEGIAQRIGMNSQNPTDEPAPGTAQASDGNTTSDED